MIRIEAIKDYLVEMLTDLTQYFETININFLSNEPENYSIDKIPTQSKIEETITGKKLMKDVYNFRCRKPYSSEMAVNLSNMGFWETFESKIYSNNEQGILPNIKEIQEIKCLNCGSIQRAGTETCEMSIQIEADYIEDGSQELSL